MLARLVLADGTVYRGESFGARGSAEGEVVFNTAMSGYEEVVTDPSHCGQIVVMTYPMIGNYGINPDDLAARRPFLRGLIVREVCDHPSNWQSGQSLPDHLREHGVIGLSGADTRAITHRIREDGPFSAVLTTQDEEDALAASRARDLGRPDWATHLEEITIRSPYTLPADGPRVAVVDLGLRDSLVDHLHGLGCEVTVVPAHTPARKLEKQGPEGVLFVGGPEDPAPRDAPVEAARALIGRVPLCGISLGQQVIALALGAATHRLPRGHRGSNHPVRDLQTGTIEITTQNHGHGVDEDSLAGLDVTVTHRHLHDGSVEGMLHNRYPIVCRQYYPDARDLQRLSSMMFFAPEEATHPCPKIQS